MVPGPNSHDCNRPHDGGSTIRDDALGHQFGQNRNSGAGSGGLE